MDQSNIELTTLNDPGAWARFSATGHLVTCTEFGERLRLTGGALAATPAQQKALGQLFAIFATTTTTQRRAEEDDGDVDEKAAKQMLAIEEERIDMRAYLLCAAFLVAREQAPLEMVRLVCKIYAEPSLTTTSVSRRTPASSSATSSASSSWASMTADEAAAGDAFEVRLTMAGMRQAMHHALSMAAEQSDALFAMLIEEKGDQQQRSLRLGEFFLLLFFVLDKLMITPDCLSALTTDDLIEQLQKMAQFKKRLSPNPENNNARPKSE